MKVACIQLNSQQHMQANIAMAEAIMREAHAAGAALLCLPENAFLMRDHDGQMPPLYQMNTHPGVLRMQSLAVELGCYILIGSIFIESPVQGKWLNRSVLIDPSGKRLSHYDKIHLFQASFPDGESYRESDRFVAGQQAPVVAMPFGGLGLSICYDLRFPRLFRDLAQAGAVALSVPAAFTRRTGAAHWHILLRARAIENGCYVIAPAQCGEHPGGRQTFGHSLIIDPWGEIIAEAGTDTGFVMAEISAEHVRQVREQLPVLLHERDYAVYAGLDPTIR